MADIGERRPIHIEDLPWEDFTDQYEAGRSPGPWVKWLVDGASGNRVMLVKSDPNRGKAAPHWHLSDTVYLVMEGEFEVEGEATYRVGDLRWVRGGFAYGPESAGPDGVVYMFISLGPYDKLDPDEFPPPLGRWDDPSTWKDSYPQIARRTRLPEDPRPKDWPGLVPS
jgi:hypothetical protein